MSFSETSPQNEVPMGVQSEGVSEKSFRKRIHWKRIWLGLVPLFLSALLFLSAFFSVFSPLPLLLVRVGRGRLAFVFASLANSAWVYFLGGWLSLGIYTLFVTASAFILGELIQLPRLQKSLTAITGTALLILLGLGLTYLGAEALQQGVSLGVRFHSQVNEWVTVLKAAMPPGAFPSEVEALEWQDRLKMEFPSGVAIFMLLMIWANLSILLRMNPERIREKMGLSFHFFREWKLWEGTVWPTLILGTLLLIGEERLGGFYGVALNGFRFLMAVYAIQGLSILSFVLDAWNVRGFLRTLAYSITVFLLMPLLLGLGFFDLWFDFRSKIRQA